ncbi:cation:proton antiporter [soil metagenome]
MHDLGFFQDLAIVLIVAAIATLLFRQFKQPVVLGYILAGVIVGPHTPGHFIHKEDTIETLGQLGVIFLMFALGLEFSFGKLKKVGATAFIAALSEILFMVFAGYELGRLFGWSKTDSIFLGAILSISSTTIIIKALEELGKKKDAFASLIIGILIVEDILAIVMLALLSGYATSGQFTFTEVSETVIGLSVFLVGLLVAGLIFVPKLLNYVAKFKSNEMLVVTCVGLCLGVALLTNYLGYSVALGSFLIGAIIAESRQIMKIEVLMHPIRDLFSAVFFVSIGLLIDPALLLQYAGPILAITAVVVIGKVISCSAGCFLAGNNIRTSAHVGMSLAQIGEFSFIIAGLGELHGVTSKFIYPIAVAVSAITTLLTPYLIKSSDAVVAGAERFLPRNLLASMDAYSQWVGVARAQNDTNLERKIITKLLWQIGLNLLLVMGFFIAAAFLHTRLLSLWPAIPFGGEGAKAVVWLSAMLLSFPILFAIWRKMEVAAMVISEMSVNPAVAGEKAPALQSIISTVITIGGTIALILFLLVLSTAILPSGKILLLLIVVVAVAGFLLYRSSVKVYANAQFALYDTFAQPADPLEMPEHGDHPPAPTPMPAMLKEAKLETVDLRDAMRSVGKMISELQLRSKTGASIVGIERRGINIINPGPTEELEAGDHLLLIGRTEELIVAKELLQEQTA